MNTEKSQTYSERLRAESRECQNGVVRQVLDILADVAEETEQAAQIVSTDVRETASMQDANGKTDLVPITGEAGDSVVITKAVPSTVPQVVPVPVTQVAPVPFPLV
jgi:hypothetical protein